MNTRCDKNDLVGRRKMTFLIRIQRNRTIRKLQEASYTNTLNRIKLKEVEYAETKMLHNQYLYHTINKYTQHRIDSFFKKINIERHKNATAQFKPIFEKTSTFSVHAQRNACVHRHVITHPFRYI